MSSEGKGGAAMAVRLRTLNLHRRPHNLASLDTFEPRYPPGLKNEASIVRAFLDKSETYGGSFLGLS